MSITGHGIKCRRDGSYFEGKPEIVELTIAKQAEELVEVTISCITYMSSDGIYLSPKGLYEKGYGFKLNAAGEMVRTVRTIGKDAHLPVEKKKSLHFADINMN